MAYYGILMKDGTEISHYGVKGMKWGKKLFGKVKGVFGKPNAPSARGPVNRSQFVSVDGKATGNTAAYLTYAFGKKKRTDSQNAVAAKQAQLSNSSRVLKQLNSKNHTPVNDKMISDMKKERVKYSKRINGK